VEAVQSNDLHLGVASSKVRAADFVLVQGQVFLSRKTSKLLVRSAIKVMEGPPLAVGSKKFPR
jgi:hypothetical protein